MWSIVCITPLISRELLRSIEQASSDPDSEELAEDDRLYLHARGLTPRNIMQCVTHLLRERIRCDDKIDM